MSQNKLTLVLYSIFVFWTLIFAKGWQLWRTLVSVRGDPWGSSGEPMKIRGDSVEIHESRDLWSPKISSCFPLGFLWLKILVYFLFCFNIFVNSFSDTWVWQYFQRNVGHEILVLIFPISSISPILTAE